MGAKAKNLQFKNDLTGIFQKQLWAGFSDNEISAVEFIGFLLLASATKQLLFGFLSSLCLCLCL